MALALHVGQRLSFKALPQRGQLFSAMVSHPQSAHFTLKVNVLQLGHLRLETSRKTGPFFAASVRSLWEPPAKLTGNRTCTRGFISRLLAFSGRPIRAPTNVGALSLTSTPASELIALNTESTWLPSTVRFVPSKGTCIISFKDKLTINKSMGRKDLSQSLSHVRLDDSNDLVNSSVFKCHFGF